MTPSMAHTFIAEATTSSTIENNAQKKLHLSSKPLREIMAPQRRSGVPPIITRREGVSMTRNNRTSETAAGLVIVTDLGEREGEENMLLKSENDQLKSIIDALKDKIASGNSGDDSVNDAMQKKDKKN
jgi:hypothetical protein